MDRRADGRGRGRPQRPAPSDTALDLKVFYFSASHRRWFFGTLIAIVLLFEIITLLFLLIEGDGNLLASARARREPLIFLAGLALLIVTDRWWVHAILFLVALGGAVFSLFVAAPIRG